MDKTPHRGTVAHLENRGIGVHIHTRTMWEVARTVVAPPSSVVKCLWEVFVWGFGVLFLSCACVSVSGVLFSVGVCVCMTC